MMIIAPRASRNRNLPGFIPMVPAARKAATRKPVMNRAMKTVLLPWSRKNCLALSRRSSDKILRICRWVMMP